MLILPNPPRARGPFCCEPPISEPISDEIPRYRDKLQDTADVRPNGRGRGAEWGC